MHPAPPDGGPKKLSDCTVDAFRILPHAEQLALFEDAAKFHWAIAKDEFERSASTDILIIGGPDHRIVALESIDVLASLTSPDGLARISAKYAQGLPVAAYVRPEKTARPDPSIDEPGISTCEKHLRAYNASDLERFCSCVDEDVRIIDPVGDREVLRGKKAFRDHYARIFGTFSDVQATLLTNTPVGDRRTDSVEQWSRRRRSYPQQRIGGVARLSFVEDRSTHLITRVFIADIEPPRVIR